MDYCASWWEQAASRAKLMTAISGRHGRVCFNIEFLRSWAEKAVGDRRVVTST